MKAKAGKDSQTRLAAANETTQPRPPLFRALGADEPPCVVQIGDEMFRRVEVYKHDSWAATAVYESRTRRAICKFNRQQSIFGIPMRWLGRRLASRERSFLGQLQGIEGVPAPLGPVKLASRVLEHAVAREYVDGHALADHEQLKDGFFTRLRQMLAEVHRRGVAHVDLHKRENILVDAQGNPHLIDFQISFGTAHCGRLSQRVLGGLLRILQRSDEYHLIKHECRHSSTSTKESADDEVARQRPWWIRLHRQLTVPLRTARRRLLTALRIRSADGHVQTETFPEVAHRCGT